VIVTIIIFNRSVFSLGVCVPRPQPPTEAQLTVLDGVALGALHEASYADFYPVLFIKKGGEMAVVLMVLKKTERLGERA